MALHSSYISSYGYLCLNSGFIFKNLLHFSKVIFLTYLDTVEYRAVEKNNFLQRGSGLVVKELNKHYSVAVTRLNTSEGHTGSNDPHT